MRPHSLICRTKFALLHPVKKNSIRYENIATFFLSRARPGTPTRREKFFEERIFSTPPPCDIDRFVPVQAQRDSAQEGVSASRPQAHGKPAAASIIRHKLILSRVMERRMLACF